MIQTEGVVLYDARNQKSSVVYAEIVRLEVDIYSNINSLLIEEYIVIKDEETGKMVKEHIIIKGDTRFIHNVSFAQEDQIRKMVGKTGLSGRDETMFALQQGHLYQNNQDKVYGAKRIACKNPLLVNKEEDENI